jgi:hypothetical protein
MSRPDRRIRPNLPEVLPPIVEEGAVTPQVIVVQQRPTKPMDRLPASGWFARSFAVTAGYIVAVSVFAIVGFGLCFLACSGLALTAAQGVRETTRKMEAENARMEAELRRSESEKEFVGASRSDEPSDVPTLILPEIEPTVEEPKSDFPWRRWASRDGSFSTEAQFVSRANKRIKLRKRDETVITVDMDDLSDEDQSWLNLPAYKKRVSE